MHGKSCEYRQDLIIVIGTRQVERHEPAEELATSVELRRPVADGRISEDRVVRIYQPAARLAVIGRDSRRGGFVAVAEITGPRCHCWAEAAGGGVDLPVWTARDLGQSAGLRAPLEGRELTRRLWPADPQRRRG
jgi:hypothetical protein